MVIIPVRYVLSFFKLVQKTVTKVTMKLTIQKRKSVVSITVTVS